jgi:nucleotide-binding universal stress UspA family protein
MKTVIVGFDGSDQAGDALQLGRTLSQTTGAELVVAAVAEVDPLLSELNPLDRSRMQAFETVFAAAEKQLDGHDFTRRTMTGSVPGALELIATEGAADAIVVGSTHRGKLGRVLAGGVAERLLAGAPCAVFVAPVGYRDPGRAIRVGVAYDGREEARLALDLAADLARAAGTPLQVITVDATPSDWVSHKSAGYESALHQYFAERLQEAVKGLGDDAEVEPVLETGDAIETLARQTEQLDLLVLGSRGYGPLRRVLLGGVGRRLIERAACPLALTPRGTTSQAARELPGGGGG